MGGLYDVGTPMKLFLYTYPKHDQTIHIIVTCA